MNEDEVYMYLGTTGSLDLDLHVALHGFAIELRFLNLGVVYR